MSREVRRMPLDFDWPLNRPWAGYFRPERLKPDECPDCEHGMSPHARKLHSLWYGYVPFYPESTGSTPFDRYTPQVRTKAAWNVENAPEYYGYGEPAILREADRLSGLYNSSWSHHLDQDDADALVAAGRLRSLTHTFERGTGWVENDPPTHPTAAEVNIYSLVGMGHDTLNCHIVIEARCKREGEPYRCITCDGHGSLESFEGQREESENWVGEEPPTGEGWQLWETVSEGSPITPVYETREELIEFLMSEANDWGSSRPLSREEAEAFVGVGFSVGSAATVNGEFFQGDAAVLALQKAHED